MFVPAETKTIKQQGDTKCLKVAKQNISNIEIFLSAFNSERNLKYVDKFESKSSSLTCFLKFMSFLFL